MKNKLEALIFSLLFLIGAAGLSHPSLNKTFNFMTFFFLLFTGIYSLIRSIRGNAKSIIIIFIVFLLTYLIEVAGVVTGAVFGQYEYGEGLGLKIMNVPPVIGLNWLILMLGGLSTAFLFTDNRVLASFISGILLVFLDVLIEPSAIKYGWWFWEKTIVPFSNYAAWFLLAFFFSMLLFSVDLKKNSSILRYMYFMQLGFFILLYVA